MRTVPSLAPVDQAWSDLQPSWSESDAHRRFLELATRFEGLDVAAALYKQRTLEQPDDPRAREGLSRAVTVAQGLYAARAHDSASGYDKVRRFILIFAGLTVGAAAVYFLTFLLRHQ